MVSESLSSGEVGLPTERKTVSETRSTLSRLTLPRFQLARPEANSYRRGSHCRTEGDSTLLPIWSDSLLGHDYKTKSPSTLPTLIPPVRHFDDVWRVKSPVSFGVVGLRYRDGKTNGEIRPGLNAHTLDTSTYPGTRMFPEYEQNYETVVTEL